uniref:Glutathione peroxidase n=1 Tax=Callorhinchus milii TaxID=7868 RepID=A0A4W3I3V2_CALMI
MNALMENFTGSPFTVLGFPCNQFGHQDPEEDSEVLNVLKYVRPGNGFVPNFPIFGKILVNGESEHPLYTFLKVKRCTPNNNPSKKPKTIIKLLHWSPLKVSDIRWNFEKFLVDGNGRPLKRYDISAPFNIIEEDIASLLKEATED